MHETNVINMIKEEKDSRVFTANDLKLKLQCKKPTSKAMLAFRLTRRNFKIINKDDFRLVCMYLVWIGIITSKEARSRSIRFQEPSIDYQPLNDLETPTKVGTRN